MKEFLNKFHPVEDNILDEYIGLWQPFNVDKRTIMTSPGDIEKQLYFVIDGIQKSYYLKEDKQHIIAFTYSPSFSGIPESFLTQTPSNYFLETITDSQFMRISYDQHQRYMQDHRAIETLFRKATEHFLIGMVQRYYELMAFDINERFQAFARRSPHLFNTITHKDLASYLRIDATNFSKLYNSIKI